MASRKRKARRRKNARAQHDLTIQHAVRSARAELKRALSLALDRLEALALVEEELLRRWALRPEVHAQAIRSELGPLFGGQADSDVRNLQPSEPAPLLLCDTPECPNPVPHERVQKGPHVCRSCLADPREPGNVPGAGSS